jgi:hypothetical protein
MSYSIIKLTIYEQINKNKIYIYLYKLMILFFLLNKKAIKKL